MASNGTGLSNGHINGHTNYSVPDEGRKVFYNYILADERISKDLPPEVKEAASLVQFTGSPHPSLPINWRLAEAVSSLKALESTLINTLIHRKYSAPLQPVTIDTDHATLFILSGSLWAIDPDGQNITAKDTEAVEKFFPNTDIHRSFATLYRSVASNIYRCKDGRDFQLHRDMNSSPALKVLGLPGDDVATGYEDVVGKYQAKAGQIDSAELRRRLVEVGQSGEVCLGVEEFNASEHGLANRHVGLWEIYDYPNESQPAGWWPEIEATSVSRPLAGLKVVDLTRVIAAPAVTRGLAELGASVMRVTAPHLPDASTFHPDLNWGKWNCHLDLCQPSDRDKLKALILEADVVVSGYRPGVLDKYGFGQEQIIDLCASRPRGIIAVRENCYGWHGPYAGRSGWQQISDAICGASQGFGNALGHGEAVQPIFPHSDYCTGIAGTSAILIALMRRAEKGGSYAVDLALNYYTTWLVNSVGEYPREVFEDVWEECGSRVWRHWHCNQLTAPETMKALRAGPGGKRTLKPEYFEDRSAPGILGKKKFRHIKPIAQWPEGTVKPGFRIGTRGNGVDAPHWPEDLSVEVVA